MKRRTKRLGDWGIGGLGAGSRPLSRPPALPFPHSPILLLAALLLAGCGRAPDSGSAEAPLYVHLALSTNSIHVGDIVTVDLTVRHPAGGSLQIPELGGGKEILVRSRDWSSRELPDGRVETAVRYAVTSFRTGEHVLATGMVQCAMSDGQILETAIPPAALSVTSLLGAGEGEIRDIRGPVRWPRAVPRWVWVFALVALAAFVLAWAAARFLARRRTILNYPPPPPAHEVARRALRRLKERQLIEQGLVELFFVELSAIARRYLEDRFNLRAPEQTTEEFIRDAATGEMLNAAHRHLTREFLEQSDLVKFARHQPAADDMRNTLAAAERLVEETIPVEPTAGKEQQG